jgi:hypothetical protein
MIFQPYAAQVRFSADDTVPEGRWREYLAGFLENLALRCDVPGTSVIGHIKALGLFQDHRYLRASLVSTGHPADVEGNPPDEFRQMDITLNVLVYGLDRTVIEALVGAVILEVDQGFPGSISLLPAKMEFPVFPG